tara:strand:+ start:3897 stop:6521 length:2625 start_codon:yes stop_codon:yes gene_type:complete
MTTRTNAKKLPKDILPIGYDITLRPDLRNFSFTGEESVILNIKNSTNVICINSVELEIKECYLNYKEDHKIKPSSIKYDNNAEIIYLYFDIKIKPGEVTLFLKFTGKISDNLRGFYRSKYIDPDGETQYLVTTQFEPTDARRAFPCWDEPIFKSKFKIKLIIPSHLEAISNMPIEEIKHIDPSNKYVSFAESPIMSTYLIAFVIGNLVSIQKKSTHGTMIRIWATPDKKDQCGFALETSLKLLDYFNEYFAIPYPLPKLDHIAIPDFAAGAMENWGAVTYREIALLITPNDSSVLAKQRVASIIAHEMAHMWFGDLVTMKWWNDLWLNESFASWMGDKAVNEIFPEWEVWTEFVSSDTNRGLALDGLANSHPIEQTVNNPSEIEELFDAISYSKGASIIRMLENYLGEDLFREGLRHYIKTHSYSNAETNHLWESLSLKSKKNVKSIMDSWTKQTGYPIIHTKFKRVNNNVDIELKQEQFKYENIENPNNGNKTNWQVPIQIQTIENKLNIGAYDKNWEPIILKENSKYQSISIPITSKEEWVKINPGQTGFYRVKYPKNELEKLVSGIINLQIPSIDRLGIQNDAYAFSKAGYIYASEFLSLANNYQNENNPIVCRDLADNLSNIDMLLWDEPYHKIFQNFAKNIFNLTFKKTGWDPTDTENDHQKLLRSTILTQMGKYEEISVLNEANIRFENYFNKLKDLEPDLKGLIFNLSATNGNNETYRKIWDLHKTSINPEEKLRLIISLGKFKQKELLINTLEKSISPDIRTQDSISVIASVAMNKYGRDLAWTFIKDNWKSLSKLYGGGGFGLMQLVSITSIFSNEKMKNEVEKFFTDNPTPSANRTILQSLERIKLNSMWLNKNRKDLKIFLNI